MSFIHECLVQVFTSHLSSEQPVRQRQVQAALPAPGCPSCLLQDWWCPSGMILRVQSTENRVQSTEYRVQSTENRVQNTEYRKQSTEYRVQSSEYRVQNTEYRVQSTEYRKQSTEYRAQSTGSSQLTAQPLPLSDSLIEMLPHVIKMLIDRPEPVSPQASGISEKRVLLGTIWLLWVCTSPHTGKSTDQFVPRGGRGHTVTYWALLATSLALDMVVVSRCAGHLTAVLSREREREREVRDGKISARVARRAVPVSAEGVKKALPAPAASPVQAVRWWRQDRLRHWSQQPVRQTAMNSKLVTSAATLLLLLCLVETGECHRVKVCEQPGKLICSHPRTITTSQLLWPPAKNSFAKNISDEISENISPPHHHRSSLEWRE